MNEKFKRLQDEVKTLSEVDDSQRERIQWLRNRNCELYQLLHEAYDKIDRLEKALKAQNDNEMERLRHPEMYWYEK